ncbi:hypothetical protein HanIR_Chr02g0070901 [Helianthus annuus]|nr:hypothetical protein HanIR_Chr02g0070901 [Helianthus annuus]
MDDLSGSGGNQQDVCGKPRASFAEIAARFLDVEGNTWKPKRGVVGSAPVSLGNLDTTFWDSPGMGYTPISGLDKTNSVADQGLDKSAGIDTPISFANVVKNPKENIKVNFRAMESSEVVDGADVVIPLTSVKQVTDRYANTLYGYFLGKRLAFPVVDFFAKNNWAKYGLSRLMMNANGFFFFKFKTKEGMDQMLEDGPWLIRNVPIILKEWSASIKMEKEDIKVVPVWVKMHDVPLAAFTEDGLSLVASKIGVPKMLDSYTATMCAES